MSGLWRDDYSSRKATYDLTRLRRKGFIERVGGTQTYRLTPEGRRIACFFTKLAARVVVPALTELEAAARPRAPAPRALVGAWRAYEREVEALIAASGVAA
jgi:predicted MarR family transcription regulator